MAWPYTDPVYSSADGSMIDCMVTHPVWGVIPFTANLNDVEPEGRAMHNEIMAHADKVPIGAFVPPAAPDLTKGSAPQEIG